MRCETCGQRLLPEDGTQCPSCKAAEVAEHQATEAAAREATINRDAAIADARRGSELQAGGTDAPPGGCLLAGWLGAGLVAGILCLVAGTSDLPLVALFGALALVVLAAWIHGAKAAFAAAAGLLTIGFLVGACVAAFL